jgi:sugar diacid utilization regulator
LAWNHQVPKELAERVVQIIYEVTGSNVNLMGQGGEIIATKQPERLGTIHAGAQKIMNGQAEEVAITVADASQLQGVKPGYNGVILFDGKRIGCIGISGDPEQVRPLQKMAAIIIAEELKKIKLLRLENYF